MVRDVDGLVPFDVTVPEGTNTSPDLADAYALASERLDHAFCYAGLDITTTWMTHVTAPRGKG